MTCFNRQHFFSAGIGRTGVYLAIEPLMESMKQKKTVNIFERVIELRKYRYNMVQNSVSKIQLICNKNNLCLFKMLFLFSIGPI